MNSYLKLSLDSKQTVAWCKILGAAILVGTITAVVLLTIGGMDSEDSGHGPDLNYEPRLVLDTSGFDLVLASLESWNADASLQQVGDSWDQAGYRLIEKIDQELATGTIPDEHKIHLLVVKSLLYNFEGEPRKAYQMLSQGRAKIEDRAALAEKFLYTIVYLQGLAGLRRGEDENCILCRGESSCILPIMPAAIHTNPAGSRLAVKHFSEYLEKFPDDLEVRWLLNLAVMTLGESSHNVHAKYRIALEPFRNSEFDIGKFRDIGHLVGVNRLNQSGGGIMEDFDNDGLLDIVVTAIDPTMPMAYYRNKGDGTFEDRTEAAGLTHQLGGLNCVQTDYNNDGHMDIYIPRGAWIHLPIRPSLLRNNGDGTFTDVTREAGLLDPINSISASWADYDNDGWLDLYVCCDKPPNRLYRNNGDGTFSEVAAKAGVGGNNVSCKGAAWVDYDNDDFPDLFVNYLSRTARLYRNNRNGTFTETTNAMGIDGPDWGFSCWAWDYDNDGWLDIFATSYDHTLADIVNGLRGRQHKRNSNKLFRNVSGMGFEDITKSAGLDMVFAAMGSNYGDFDNDGFLDMYLGTGAPSLDILVPNRMFKNVAGRRFSEITVSSRTGHLQKGHGVACGDWDSDGDVDIFIQMGGAINGDKYHNVLFQNPGRRNNWLTVKLIGTKTNRPAIGARVKVITDGTKPLTIHRHISSGSSFGANPLEQTIGLGQAKRIALLEIRWPTSKTVQVFQNVAVNQVIEVTEFSEQYRKLKRQPISLPE